MYFIKPKFWDKKKNSFLSILLYPLSIIYYLISIIKKKISIEDLGFLIGPIINAGGRLNYSNYGVELLSSDNQEIIKKNR